MTFCANRGRLRDMRRVSMLNVGSSPEVQSNARVAGNIQRPVELQLVEMRAVELMAFLNSGIHRVW
jgi:hypothetical protein